MCRWAVHFKGPRRNQVSYVSQDPFLFHDTILANLLWAHPQAREDEIWEALRLSGADKIVKRMENQLDTIVGERGVLMSGGERQRFALSRALIRKPRLLILDEATNAIDIAGEREIFENIKKLQPRPTIVVVAHRQETLQLCNRILIFEKGRIVADGPPEILAYKADRGNGAS